MKPFIEELRKEYAVVVANSAEKAVALASSGQRIDAAVISTTLQHSDDGIALCADLMALPDKQAPWVFLINGTGAEDERQRGLGAGARDVMPAPLSPGELCARLAEQF